MKLNKFKHKAVVLTAGVATLFATSCKDFLEEDLYDVNSSNGLSKYEQFQSLTSPLFGGKLWGPYERKFSWCVNEALPGVLYCDYSQEGDLFKLSIDGDNEVLREGYTSLYSGVIATANQVINKITRIQEGIDPKPEGWSVSDKQLREVKAEALLYRAFAHFLATEYFGNVPLVLNTEKDLAQAVKLPLVNRKTLYTAIEKDLNQAILDLPLTPSNDKRPCIWTAKALLAKLYLTMASCQSPVPGAPYLETDVAGKYQKVKDLCTEIIGSGKYNFEKHSSMFSYLKANQPSNETIFALYFVQGEYGDGSAYQSQIACSDVWSPESGWGEGKGITYNLYKSFDNSDERKKELCIFVDAGPYLLANGDTAIYGKDFTGSEGQVDGKPGSAFFQTTGGMVFNHVKKYIWGVNGTSSHEKGMSISRRIDLIRLSDVYMMRAEAAMAMVNPGVCDPSSAGIDDINAVLKAHGAAELTEAIPFFENLEEKRKTVESFTIILDDSTTANEDVPLTEFMYHSVDRNDLMQERRKEFAMEGQAWLDLKRLYYRNPQMAEKFLVQMDRGAQMSAIPNIAKIDKGLLEVEDGYARRNVVKELNKILASHYPDKWTEPKGDGELTILIDNFTSNNFWFLPIPVSAQTGLDIDENGLVKDFVSEVERGTYPY